MTNVQTGKQMQFEILLDNPIFERIMQPIRAESATHRHQGEHSDRIDSSQYKNEPTTTTTT